MNINWKRKLSSRKFWAAVAGLVTAILVAFNASDMTVQQIGAIIAALGVLVAYIMGESKVDAARTEKGEKHEQQSSDSAHENQPK